MAMQFFLSTQPEHRRFQNPFLLRANLRVGLLLAGLILPAAVTAQSALQKAMHDLTADPSLRYAGVGVCVTDVASNRVIASHQASLSLIPASTLKLLSTATALAVLGPGYRFLTQLEYDGALNGKVLEGNLYLTGYGDPTLGSPQLKGAMDMDAILAKFRDAILAKNIRTIKGYVVGDGSYFSTAANASSWAWNDLGNYYASGAWGLNFHENLYYLRFQRTAGVGATPRIAIIEPEVSGLEFINEVKQAPAGTGDNAYIFGAPYTTFRFVRGTIPAGSGYFSIKGSLPDPPYFAAYHLDQYLAKAGVQTAKGPLSQLQLPPDQSHSKKREVLFRHYSPPLKDIIREAHYESVNLYCESLLKLLGKKQKGEGSTEAGLQFVQDFWMKKGLRFDGCFLADGSGLSSRNAVTAEFMAGFLAKVGRDDKLYPIFAESLATAGRSGNLANKFRGTAAEGKLRAKSGSFERVRAYAGYATTAAGRTVAFSIIVNNYTGDGNAIRQKMERFMQALCEIK